MFHFPPSEAGSGCREAIREYENKQKFHAASILAEGRAASKSASQTIPPSALPDNDEPVAAPPPPEAPPLVSTELASAGARAPAEATVQSPAPPTTSAREASTGSGDSFVVVDNPLAAPPADVISPSDKQRADELRQKGRAAFERWEKGGSRKDEHRKEAERCWQEATECDPHDARAYNNLAHIFIKRKCFKEALEMAERAVAIVSMTPSTNAYKSYLRRAQAHESLGNLLQAAADRDKAKVLTPEDVCAQPVKQPAPPAVQSDTQRAEDTSAQTMRPTQDSDRSEPASEGSGASSSSSFVHVTRPVTESSPCHDATPGTSGDVEPDATPDVTAEKRGMRPMVDLPQTTELHKDGNVTTRYHVKEIGKVGGKARQAGNLKATKEPAADKVTASNPSRSGTDSKVAPGPSNSSADKQEAACLNSGGAVTRPAPKSDDVKRVSAKVSKASVRASQLSALWYVCPTRIHCD